MNRASEFIKVKKCIEKNYVNGGIFNTRNIAGDTLETIFEGKYFTVDICKYYGYFEVFGTTKKEFKNLCEFYAKLNNKKITKGEATMKNEKTYTTKEILKAIKDTTKKILERNIKANEKIDNSMARTVTNMKESMLITEFYSYLIEELNIDEELLK